MKDKPAFPQRFSLYGYFSEEATETIMKDSSGMSLREYAAVSALKGLCSKRFHENLEKKWVDWATDLSIELADELLNKLQKAKNGQRETQNRE
jgi:hypothetical protein